MTIQITEHWLWFVGGCFYSGFIFLVWVANGGLIRKKKKAKR